MFINKQNDLERKTFPYISCQILLEEIDELFVKKDNSFFEMAYIVNHNDGTYAYMKIKGESIFRGIIEIGPFLTNTQGNQEILKFRLLIQTDNKLVEDYTSCVNGNSYVNFFEEEHNDNYYQIKFQYNTFNIEWLINNGFNNEDIYKKDIYQFGFDDNTYKQYGGFYIYLCKTIAAYAFCYFSTLKTNKDNFSIKEICEKLDKERDEPDITFS